MTRLFGLSGRTALVTGSARGLGHAVARGLGEAGATVVLDDVVGDRLDAVVARLRADGVDAHVGGGLLAALSSMTVTAVEWRWCP